MAAKDRRKDHAAELLGWRTERGTWYDVRRRQDALVARAREGQSSLERMWTFWSRPMAIRLANMEDPP
jgi:hypothetical protein